ncbi:MAG: hypothetical protein OXC09_09790 [Truepera sp.]|nr:hypothetical protein [Truepera sp.]
METSSVAVVGPEPRDFERVFVHPAIDGFVSPTTMIRIATVAGIVPR